MRGVDDLRGPLNGTGFLVPRRSPHKGREPWAVTACTYLDRKWSHLERAGEVLLRASLGRVDDIRAVEWSDEEVADRAWEELGALMGVRGQPVGARVVRFADAFPQYRVHHLLRTAGIESALARLGGVAVAGAATAVSASPPASPAAGPRPRRSCERPAAPGPHRHPLGRSGCPPGALASPWGWWPLGLLGAALLYWRLAGLSLRTRLWSGWLAGLGCYAIGLFWARAFNWYGAVVLILIEALYFAAAAAATPPRRGRALAFVAACTLAEAVRLSWPFGGLPLGGVFLGQARGPLVELARLGGPLLITAGVWAGGVALATLVGALQGRRRDGATMPSVMGPLVIAAGIVALASLGAVAPDGGAAVRTVRVALVQGGGQRGLSKQQVAPSSVFSAQLAATFAVASAHPAPGLVLWPEDVVALDQPLARSPQAALLSRLATQLHTTLVVGVTEPASATSFRNEVVSWGPNGHIVGVFEKVHRVPFGEYVPLRSLFSHFANLSGVPLDAVPGHGSGLMRTPAAPLGLLVSFEIFYAGRSHESVRAGAELLAVPTNTSSYSTSQVPAQEMAAAIIQAVETGRDLVQAAPTGFSAVVTQRGVVLQRSSLGRRQVLLATVGLRRGFTPYDHWGDLPVLVLAVLALIAGWGRQLHYS